MKRAAPLAGLRGLLAVAAALVVVSVSSVALATRDGAKETKIEQAVGAVDEKLLPTLREGNAASDRGDDAAAAKAYARVHAGAPAVADVTRRLCTAEARIGDFESAVSHCREALASEPSPENHAALAVALISKRPRGAGDADEAQSEARVAVGLAPDAEFAQATLCEIAAARGDIPTLSTCSARLQAIAPTAPETHLFAALVLGHNGDIDAAERQLEHARAAGLSAKLNDATRADLEGARPKPQPVRTALWATIASWIGLLFVVLVAGMLLGDAVPRSRSRLLRGTTRGLLVVASALYYVSAVLVAVVLAGGIGLVVVAFLAIAAPSRPVEISLALVGIYLVIGMVRALLAKVPPDDMGVSVARQDHPELWRVLEEASSSVRMPKLDRVHLRPDATIAVRELGGPFGHLRGKNERVLVLGVAALEGLTQRQLVALVAANLAQLRGGDAGGDLAIVARASFDAALERMDARGVAIDTNPGWWFVRAYRALFVRIAAGPIVRQEELADQRACDACGADALGAALRHLARCEVETAARARASVRHAIEGEAMSDLFGSAIDEDVRADIDEAVEELGERLARIHRDQEDEPLVEGVGDEPAWQLFSDRTAIEDEVALRARRELRERTGFGSADDQPSSESSVARA